jgi:hypothetical protein
MKTIGGYDCSRWNMMAREAMHRSLPISCPRCTAFNSDYKILKIGFELWYGGCQACSDDDTRAIRKMMMGDDVNTLSLADEKQLERPGRE